MTLLENRGLWTFIGVFILLPLLVVLLALVAGGYEAWSLVLLLLAFIWLGTGVIVGSGYIAGEA